MTAIESPLVERKLTVPGTNDAVAVGDVDGVGKTNVGVGVGAMDAVPVAVFDWPLATASSTTSSAANSARAEGSVRGGMLAVACVGERARVGEEARAIHGQDNKTDAIGANAEAKQRS